MAAAYMPAIIEELLKVVFCAWSMLRLYNGGQLSLEESLEMAVRRVGGWYEVAAPTWESVEWSGVK
jgi:hypothetical protein